MSNLNIIISLLQIPGAILKSSGPSSFLLTLPVKPHSCPCCRTSTSFIHGYYSQPVKSALFMDMGASLVYRNILFQNGKSKICCDRSKRQL